MNDLGESGLAFRLMLESDLEEIMQLENRGHAFPWTLGIFQDCVRVGYYCPMLVSDNKIVAYAVMSVAAGEAHIFNICVDSSWRQRGLGKKIMLYLLDEAKKRNAQTAFLEVRVSNEIALALYDQLGFTEIGVRKDYYPAANNSKEDAVIMAIDLSF